MRRHEYPDTYEKLVALVQAAAPEWTLAEVEAWIKARTVEQNEERLARKRDRDAQELDRLAAAGWTDDDATDPQPEKLSDIPWLVALARLREKGERP